MSIVIGRPINGIGLNGLEFMMNDDNTDYKLFKDKREAMDYLNSLMEEQLMDDELEDGFVFLNPETDFENDKELN
jgi:hypothetical protein